MCHYMQVRHALCGDFSCRLVSHCPVGEGSGGRHCHDRREDQGTMQLETLCKACQSRREQARRHGVENPLQLLLAELRLKTAGTRGGGKHGAARGCAKGSLGAI